MILDGFRGFWGPAFGAGLVLEYLEPSGGPGALLRHADDVRGVVQAPCHEVLDPKVDGNQRETHEKQ